jgi:hypothetical protein
VSLHKLYHPVQIKEALELMLYDYMSDACDYGIKVDLSMVRNGAAMMTKAGDMPPLGSSWN